MAHFPLTPHPPVPATARAARAAWEALEPLHNLSYFAPDVEAHLKKVGLKGRLMPYFAQRAAAMGPVSTSLVTAAFYNFNPVTVHNNLMEAWDFVPPADVIAARYEAVDRCLRRLLGSVVDGPEVAEAAELARRAAEEACRYPQGRVLFAAHSDLPWPERPHMVLWHAQTLLREFRGDGHQATLLTAGVSGIEALVLYVATERVDGEALRLTRGWPSDTWRATHDSLRDQGLLGDGDEPHVTELGGELRRWIEDRTDLGALPAYRVLGEDGCLRLAELGVQIARPVVEADLIPWLKKKRVASRRDRSRAVSRAGR